MRGTHLSTYNVRHSTGSRSGRSDKFPPLRCCMSARPAQGRPAQGQGNFCLCPIMWPHASPGAMAAQRKMAPVTGLHKPVQHAPKRWPPAWLAFYQTKVFNDESYAIRYWGRVSRIAQVKRQELFPHELSCARADREYFRVHLHSLERLAQPIPSRRWRRITFIGTTWAKLSRAAEVNDLFDDSPLEDALRAGPTANAIDAERQWLAKFGDADERP